MIITTYKKENYGEISQRCNITIYGLEEVNEERRKEERKGKERRKEAFLCRGQKLTDILSAIVDQICYRDWAVGFILTKEVWQTVPRTTQSVTE